MGAPGARRAHFKRGGPAKPCAILTAGAVVAALGLSACGGDPPQIVDYSPQRNTIDVSTAAPVRITFDHDVDRASVESRLHLSPANGGSIEWVNGHQLVYHHPTLHTLTTYQVILESGYRDLAGNTYTLRHHWGFTTEAPPNLAGSSPASGDGGVDTSAYLKVDFTRAMDATTLKSAHSMYVSIRPMQSAQSSPRRSSLRRTPTTRSSSTPPPSTWTATSWATTRLSRSPPALCSRCITGSHSPPTASTARPAACGS